MRKNKLFLLLVLLLTAATGAWADETPLVTINASSDFTSGSKTFDDKVTVTYSSSVDYHSSFGWYAIGASKASLLTVAGINGYTITSCKFYTANGTAATGYTVEGESPSVYLAGAGVYIDDSKSLKIGEPGLTKIEVFGAAASAPTTYTVSLKAETADEGNWTAKAGEGEYQSLPLEGVAEGTQVTVTYAGLKKVKSVKAVKKAAATTYTLLSAATAEDVGKVVCAAGHLHDAKTAVPDGCTAVGILGKVTATGHGLILALQNAKSQVWNTINGWASVTDYAGTTLKLLPDDDARGSLTSYTALGSTAVSNWAVAQKSDYEAIFTNLGSMRSPDDGSGTTYDANVNAYITEGVGGTALTSYYFSATEKDDTYAWDFNSNYWQGYKKVNSDQVRPVLGF